MVAYSISAPRAARRPPAPFEVITTHPARDDLQRVIGFWGGFALIVGITIGSGVFRKPYTLAHDVGDPVAILALWVGFGVVSLCGALALAERLLDVGAAVAVRVAQGDDPALGRLHVDVAVRGDGQEADGAGGVPVLQGVRYYDRTEAVGQGDAAVVGIRGQGGGPGRSGSGRLALNGGDHAARAEHGEHEDRDGAGARLK